MMTVAFAEDDGQITVAPNYKDQVYELYQLFAAETVEGRTDGGTGISYKLMSGKTNLKATVNGAEVDGTTWFTLDTAGNITIKDSAAAAILSGIGPNTTSAANRDAFIAWAKAYGVSKGTKTATADNDPAVKWTALPEGYYFLTTTTGALVSLDSIKPNVTVQDKNDVPGQEKKITDVLVGDTSKGSGNIFEEGDSATAGITDIIKFTSTITAKKGAESYVFHDIMSDGLTLLTDSAHDLVVTAKVGDAEATTLRAGTDYVKTVFEQKTGAEVEDITITFQKSYLDTITQDTTITLTYYGQINEGAVIESTGNPNKSRLEYGHNTNSNYTPWDEVKVYVFDFNVHKYAGTLGAEDEIKLQGVKFVLSAKGDLGDISADASNNLTFANSGSSVADLISVHMDGSNYEKDLTTPSTGAQYVITTGTNGNAIIQGLDKGTYYLYEVATLDGYNKLTTPIKVEVVQVMDGTTLTGTDTVTVDNVAQNNDTVNVLNSQGAELPSTGGIGTTLFYIGGGILVLLAVVMLVTKKRMKAED